ncbi:helix-turn-helix domain-containing protein [Thauera sp.]|jgi:hypothetical protein|uniref:helix-turn-helix domain-containing protein n=1 Tax=Thauera sp. TaxID=1905334 RepID=UPI00257B30D8|nr:helix-turn-helix domain-containing protein [Thauera sp.]
MSEGSVFHRAYRYRLRSNRKVEAVLRRWAGCSRKMWNLALAEQQARRERGERYAGFARHRPHADVNAAKNILAAGHAVLAGDGQALSEGQVQPGRPVKREPTEGLRHGA